VLLTGALMPTLADDRAIGVQDHASDDRVRAGGTERGPGQLDGAAHRRLLDLGGHPAPLPRPRAAPG
jgi:hypothetical protein